MLTSDTVIALYRVTIKKTLHIMYRGTILDLYNIAVRTI